MTTSFEHFPRIAAFRSILLGIASCGASVHATKIPTAEEQVIVTAQKIEQPLQEVPLSVDVLRGEEGCSACRKYLTGTAMTSSGWLVA